MKRQFTTFLIRWVLNTFGLWFAIKLFGTGVHNEEITAGFWGFLLAGLIFSILNSVLKPIIVILSLPAILLTLGLFTFVVNGFMVWLSLMIAPGIKMSFFHSIITGIVISLINYIISSMFELQGKPEIRKEA